jgi:periplasmic protein TonB
MNTTLKIALKIALTILFATMGLAVVQAQEQASPQATQGDASAQAQQPKRVRVSQSVSKGLWIKKENPKYPEKAREQRIQGLVVLQVIVSPEGSITGLTLVSGDPLLTPAAIKAVKKWKYKPYLLNGQPVEVETTVQVNFTLSGG